MDSPIIQPITPGIYTNHELSNEQYHADREYVSSSGLKLLPDKVDEFIARYHMTHKEQPKSEALKFGGGLHSAILEPDVFPKEYVIEPEVNRRTNAGKDELKQFYAEVANNGQTVLTPENMDLIRAMRNAVRQHPIAGPALEGAEREKSFFLAGDINEKVRVDAFKKNIIMDVKSTEDMDRFFNYAAEYYYHFSEAMYRNVVRQVTGIDVEFLFIAIQKSHPFTVAVYRSDVDMRTEGQRRYRLAKENFKELRDSGGWGQVHDMVLPDWYNKKHGIY